MVEDQKSLACQVARRAKSAGLTQKTIASAIGASQSQVSRTLSSVGVRHSRLFDEICIYVDNYARRVSPETVRDNRVLMEAIANVWDGTARHAAAIAHVIRSLGALGDAKCSSTVNPQDERGSFDANSRT